MNRLVPSFIALFLLFPAGVIAEDHTVTVTNFQFTPSTLTIELGDTVTWRNASGFHNVVADDGSFRCANGCDGDGEGGNGNVAGNWSFTRKFNSVADVAYHCEAHVDLGMAGIIKVEPGQQPPPLPEFEINFGITGTWVDPAKPEARQGFLLEVVPHILDQGPFLNLFWFTYADGEPGGPGTERWFQALGPVEGNQAVMEVIQCAGGVFDQPNAAECPPVGTITAEFTSCMDGQITYALDLKGGPASETTGSVVITRLTEDFLCQDLAEQTR